MIYSVSKKFDTNVSLTERSSSVMRMFGVTLERLSESSITHYCQLEINDGDIVYITGPSGCGKSVLLNELEKMVPAAEKVNLSDIKLASDRTAVDCMPAGLDFLQALRLLSTAGLNDCLCILNNPANLSDGQKWRFRLAMALGAKKKFIFADEFCSQLDRITVAVISYNIHKFAKRYKVTFVLASSHEDILADLRPDVLIIKELSGKTQIIYKRRTANA